MVFFIQAATCRDRGACGDSAGGGRDSCGGNGRGGDGRGDGCGGDGCGSLLAAFVQNSASWHQNEQEMTKALTETRRQDWQNAWGFYM